MARGCVNVFKNLAENLLSFHCLSVFPFACLCVCLSVSVFHSVYLLTPPPPTGEVKVEYTSLKFIYVSQLIITRH